MQKSKRYFLLAISGWLIVGLCITGYVIKAWTAPGSNPPAGNVTAPINAGSGAQEKTGAFTVGSIVNNGALTCKGTTNFTPTSNAVNFFNINNASSTKIFTVDTTNKRIGVNMDTPSVAFDVTGAITASGAITGASFTTATGDIEATAGDVIGNQLCIGADCRAAWPAAGSSVPTGGIILSTTSSNPEILAAGYTEQPGWGVPYNIGGMPVGEMSVYVKNP